MVIKNSTELIHKKAVLNRFKDIYHRLDQDSVDLLESLYIPDCQFQDPLHTVSGIENLKAYFAQLYAGVSSCQFTFADEIETPDCASLTWTMNVGIRRLGGKMIPVHGATFLTFKSDLVATHRDYFDVGELIYERIPLIGIVIRRIKQSV